MLASEMRPNKFSEVLGQEAVTVSLKMMLSQGVLPRSLLFCGPKGTGKTSVARILAKAVNCTNRQAMEPCRECDGCKDSMAVIEIDAASHNGVDHVRDLQRTLSYSASRWTTVILDEAHAMSAQAFNALLKLLEEPKSRTTFIMVTTHPFKLPDTVLSRLMTFRFSPIAPETAFKVLQSANSGLPDEVLWEIAKQSDGAARNALVLLDRALLLESPTPESVSETLMGAPNVKGLIISAVKGDLQAYAEQVQSLQSSSADIRRVVASLVEEVTRLVRSKALPRQHFLRSMTVLWSVRDLRDGDTSSLASALFVLFDVLSSGTQPPILEEEEVELSPDEVINMLGGLK